MGTVPHAISKHKAEDTRAREVFRHVALMHKPPAEVAAAFGISRTNVDLIKRRMVQRLSVLVSSMTAEE